MKLQNKLFAFFLIILLCLCSFSTSFAGTTTLSVTVPSSGSGDDSGGGGSDNPVTPTEPTDPDQPQECEHVWIHYSIKAGYLKHGKQYDKCIKCGAVRNMKIIAGYCSPAAKGVKLYKGKKGFTVKWKKYSKKTLKRLSGYQIRYSKYSSMKNSKYIYVKKTKTARKINKLKSKKRYYVQVRTYRTLRGDKFYSKWSKRKSIKTK